LCIDFPLRLDPGIGSLSRQFAPVDLLRLQGFKGDMPAQVFRAKQFQYDRPSATGRVSSAAAEFV
jgi:hypothetical protein